MGTTVCKGEMLVDELAFEDRLYPSWSARSCSNAEGTGGESFRHVAKEGLGGLTAVWWVSPWQPAGFVRLIEEPATAPRTEMIARAEAVQGYRRPGTIDTMLKMLSVNG